MLAGRPGAQSAGAGVGAGPPDAPGARDGGGRPRPGAYLDMKIHLEKNLEEERQMLLQQQKLCRNRARKYFMESNRRRKAFEEKRQKQEEREYQIRERILQQRKQKFEEVTEKFQRAHVPVSQRRRAVFQNPVPPLEEALKQIQESNLKSEVNIPLFHRPATNWRAIDSALPSTLSKNDHKHQKHLVRRINRNKEMKENNIANLATNKNVFQLKLEETQKLLEDQHLSDLQKFCDEVNQITNSETLSSIDSLEAGEREEIYITLSMKPSTSTQQNSVPLQSANLQAAHLDCFDEDKLSFSKTQHINNWLTNLDAQNSQPVASFSDILIKSNVLPSWECLNSKEQNPPALSRTVGRTTRTTSDSMVFVCSPSVVALDKKGENTAESNVVRASDPTEGAVQRERPAQMESPTFKVSRAWTTAESLTQETASFSVQERPSELTWESRTASIPASSVTVLSPNLQAGGPLAENNTQIKEIDPVQCSDKLDELKNMEHERINHLNCNKEKYLFSPNFQTTCALQNSNSNDRKQKESGPSAALCNNPPDCDLPEQHSIKHSVHEQNGVRLLKSILKKESRYEHNYLRALVMKQGFKFRHQKAETVRDSIELTKQKGKGAEISKTSKKLRWFDESANLENAVDDCHPVRNRAGMAPRWLQRCHTNSGTYNLTSIPECPVHSAAGKKAKADSVPENATDLGRYEIDSVPLNSSVSLGFSFAKQAWSACRRGESKAPVHASDSKTQKTKPQRGVKFTRRTGSSKVQKGLVQNRKPTVSQPQTSSKANTVAQTQGKLIITHPPPKPPTNIKSGKNMQVSPGQSAIPEHSQNVMTQSCLSPASVLPTEYHLNQGTQESSLPFSDTCSNLPAVSPALPTPYSSECQTLAKANSNGTAFLKDGAVYCTHRSPVCEESYQSFTHRNTEEESILPWRRRINGHQNERTTDSTVTRRKQIVENKWKRLLEQKRKTSGSIGMKYTEQITHFGQNVPPSTTEQIQAPRGVKTEEVSDSTSEFLVAENLMNSSVPEDEILTAINSKHLQKPNLSQPTNVCALSAEEQKILKSLHHLDERLYYVQEAIRKNPSIKNTLQLIPLLSSQPRASLSPDVGSTVQRKY
ncbi:centrosomal protein of 126 kDa isoform 1 [Mus musculus]|uniref:Centrosomal protein of 126 kDa n=2 Tax=Mus musculus TaxID=10090 RepID=CE126_MOUSE|nr:centrosomal protein of 126 kDa isoform 1 [Mus musculus]Q0VBV7.1 RecName: Full=Centrosomal protein of 126 kDa [Mus musculus]AAI19073.1 CDNA sequence AK129341 [Mus musculus]AAI20490.1 CDNA sequence AK129341 [Mus musculus]|eukprot:NP_001038989.1 centrosomal protein of 126 kDa [Mus musculus]